MSGTRIRQVIKPDSCRGCSMFNDRCIDLGVPRKAAVLVVGGVPTEWDIDKGPFSARAAAIAKSLLITALRSASNGRPVHVEYAYATMCRPTKSDVKVTAEDIEHCSGRLRERISRADPDLVLILGRDALKSCGINATIGTMRGNFTTVNAGGKKYQALVSFHPANVMKDPGLFRVYTMDMRKAALCVTQGLTLPDMDIRTPVAFEDVMEELDNLERAIEDNWATRKAPLAISLDTETQSLRPEMMDKNIIAISLSYDDGVGLAFPWIHKDAFYPDREFYPIRWRLEEILGDHNDKIRIVEHNRKFDFKWTNLHEGLSLRLPDWDTMLVEHTLDEDKSGEYSLKQLTADYFPGWGKYEEELRSILDQLKQSKQEAYAALVKAEKDGRADQLLEWWLAKTDDGRAQFYAEMLKRGHADLKTANAITIQRRTLNGQQVIVKKWITVVKRFLRGVPDELLPEFESTLPNKDAFTEVTFEEVPLNLLLRYAAIDAIVTRKLVKEQLNGLESDRSMIAAVEKRLGTKLPTQDIMWPVHNIDIPLNTLLAEMEFHGVRIDRYLVRRYIGILEEKLSYTEDELFNLAGYQFNPNASGDVSKILFTDMKLPVLSTSDKTGDASVAADVIKDLSDMYPDNEFLDVLLRHRKISKISRTYLGGWLKHSDFDGKLHASFHQTSTATHRLSVTNPALQTVPFEVYFKIGGEDFHLNLKAVFIPDSDEFELVDIDIANAEVRVLTAYAQDEALIKAFLDGLCQHCLTGSGISQYAYEDILAHKEDKTSDQYNVRQISKRVSHVCSL